MAVQRVKYRREVNEEKRIHLRKQARDLTGGVMPSKTSPTKAVKWGKIGPPDSQKRRDYLESIRKNKRKARTKMVKEKIEDDFELVEDVAIDIDKDKQEVEKPEPAAVKEAIKEPGEAVEKDYIDYPY